MVSGGPGRRWWSQRRPTLLVRDRLSPLLGAAECLHTGVGFCGVWEEAAHSALALTRSGDIGLHCSTPDLRCVRCVWSWDPAEHHSTHELFYRASPSGAGMR